MKARFRIAKAYIAELMLARRSLPSLGEMQYVLTRRAKTHRGELFVEKVTEEGEYRVVGVKGFPGVNVYYPKEYPWSGLCGVLDECFNERHWHNYFWGGMELRSDDVVLDCGAAEGIFSVIASQEAAKTYAMEPIGIYLEGLKRTFAEIDEVEIIAAAVGHRSGKLEMQESGQGSKACADGGQVIELTTVDELFVGGRAKPTFIKADIEGYEFPMLLGAEQTIREMKPRLALTMYHHENNFVEVISFLKYLNLGYEFRLRGIAQNGHPIMLQAF